MIRLYRLSSETPKKLGLYFLLDLIKLRVLRCISSGLSNLNVSLSLEGVDFPEEALRVELEWLLALVAVRADYSRVIGHDGVGVIMSIGV